MPTPRLLRHGGRDGRGRAEALRCLSRWRAAGRCSASAGAQRAGAAMAARAAGEQRGLQPEGRLRMGAARPPPTARSLLIPAPQPDLATKWRFQTWNTRCHRTCTHGHGSCLPSPAARSVAERERSHRRAADGRAEPAPAVPRRRPQPAPHRHGPCSCFTCGSLACSRRTTPNVSVHRAEILA